MQLVQQLFVQKLLAGQRPFLRRQRLVFKRFQLGRDKALSVFQRLAAAIVVGHFAGLALRHFNVKTVDFVELHAQVADAGAGFFTAFQVE